MGVDICQNPSNEHLKWVNFIAYKLYFSTVALNINAIQSAYHTYRIPPASSLLISPSSLPLPSILATPAGFPDILHIVHAHSLLWGFALAVPCGCPRDSLHHLLQSSVQKVPTSVASLTPALA